jgi:hypothetical protein
MNTGNQAKLIVIKSIHTLVWLMFVIIIAFILWSGFTANISVYSWLAVAAIIGEGLVLVFFKGSCPLTKVARKYSNSQKENFDIYLPEWLAKYNKLIFGALFFIGLILILYKAFPK